MSFGGNNVIKHSNKIKTQDSFGVPYEEAQNKMDIDDNNNINENEKDE